MPEWQESEHPRDKEGKFTFKGLGENSTQSNEEKMQKRAEILFPKTQEKTSNFTGGAAKIQEYNKGYIEKLQNSAQTDSDKSFLNNLDYILEIEGGYNNKKGDVPTNLGVTQGIYNVYRKEKGLTIQNVKNIKIDEAVPIYYKYFWKPSGADKLPHPLDLVYFDMYINSNPREAKNVLNISDNDVYKLIENRRKFYDDVIKNKPIKKHFKMGWDNRLNKLKKYVDNYYQNNSNKNN